MDGREAHPDRFIPSCSVNPWYGAGGLEELRRALGLGARMVVLHPAVQGYQANDELVWPVLEVAAGERVPVYVHTGNPGSASPWQVVDLAERYPGLDLIIGYRPAAVGLGLWFRFLGSDRVPAQPDTPGADRGRGARKDPRCKSAAAAGFDRL